MAPSRLRYFLPAGLALLVTAGFVLVRLGRAGWDPVALADPGTRYTEGDPQGTEGYDGQFVYYIAIDPDPGRVSPKLDVPAYRYQRILYPMLARVLAAGDPRWIPWTLILIAVVAHVAGTLAVTALLEGYGQPALYALAYGLWAGLVAAAGLDLHEPLAYALVAAAWLARRKLRPAAGAGLMGLALFAKETSLVFWGGCLVADLVTPTTRRRAGWLILAAAPFALWQFWLWGTFGSPGLGSGGAYATPFEWIPFMGLWRVGGVHLVVLALYLAILGPTIVFPAAWAILASIRRIWRGDLSQETVSLFANASAVAFLPFSTFREPFSVLRVASGLVLAILIYAAHHGLRRPLNYSLFWISLLVILIRD